MHYETSFGWEVPVSPAPDAKALRRQLWSTHREQIKALQTLKPTYNVKIFVLFAFWAAGATLMVTTDHVLRLPVVWFLCTTGMLGMAILMHDAAHHLLAKSAGWNRWLGFVCGAPALISTTAYRINHTEHHAFTGTDRDSGDPVAHANKTGLSVGRLTTIFLLIGTVLVLPAIAHGAWKKADATQRRQIAVEYALITVGVLLAAVFVPPVVLLHVWVIPFVLGSVANNIRSIAEHAFTERTDSLRNARTMRGSPWVNFVQSNVNYHWEHHLFPNVPWYHLPALHELLAPEREEVGIPMAGGYLDWARREVLPRLR